jgi:hypothetical protein
MSIIFSDNINLPNMTVVRSLLFSYIGHNCHITLVCFIKGLAVIGLEMVHPSEQLYKYRTTANRLKARNIAILLLLKSPFM